MLQLSLCLPQPEKAMVIQTILFVSGLNTLLQSLFGTRLPTVVVGSYSYVVPTTLVLLATRYGTVTDPHEVGFILFSSLENSLYTVLFLNSAFWLFSPEIHEGNERNTRCSYYYCVFSNGYGFYGLLEKCCKVNYVELKYELLSPVGMGNV